MPSALRTIALLFRRYIGGGEAAVDHERCPVDIARLVARQKKRRVGNLASLCQATHREVHATPLIRTWVVVEEPHEQRSFHRTRAQRVDSNTLTSELHRQ